MLLVFQLAARNALRNKRRSALTAVTVLLGTALLTVALAWINGVMGSFLDLGVQAVGEVRVVNQDYLKREQLSPLYLNIPVTAPAVEAIRATPGVKSAYPRIQTGVAASTGGEEIGENFGMLVGAPVDFFTEVSGLRERVKVGRYFSDDDTTAQGEALVGQVLADQIGVTAGQEAIFLGQTQDGSISPIKVSVVGVVETGNSLYDRQVFVHIEKARWLADIPQGAVEILVFGDGTRSPSALAADVEQRVSGLTEAVGLPGGALKAQAWSDREPWNGMLALIKVVFGAIGAIFVFITALGVLNTMLMSVLERTGEIGVLRAMGLRPYGVVIMFVVEALVIAAVGGAIGVAIGSLGGVWLEVHGLDLGDAMARMPSTMPVNRVLRADWTPWVAELAFALGLVMALVGSATPSLRAVRVQPVEAMRSRR